MSHIKFGACEDRILRRTSYTSLKFVSIIHEFNVFVPRILIYCQPLILQTDVSLTTWNPFTFTLFGNTPPEAYMCQAEVSALPRQCSPSSPANVSWYFTKPRNYICLTRIGCTTHEHVAYSLRYLFTLTTRIRSIIR